MTEAAPAWGTDPRIGEICAIIAKEAGIDIARLQPAARIEDLGIASLDIVQSIFEIEQRFDIEIPPLAAAAAGEFATIGDLVGHVLTTLGADHPAVLTTSDHAA